MPKHLIDLPANWQSFASLEASKKIKKVGNEFSAFFCAEKKKLTINIYDQISSYYGVSSSDIRNTLDSHPDASSILIRLNSPGGSVFEGFAIYNDLIGFNADIEVEITGMAASIAAVIAQAGNSIKMAKNARYMIHNSWMIAMGDSRILREQALLLESIDLDQISLFSEKTGKSHADIKEFLDAETWFTAQKAKDHGFIDGITGEQESKAQFDLSLYKNAPIHLQKPSDFCLQDKNIVSDDVGDDADDLQEILNQLKNFNAQYKEF